MIAQVTEISRADALDLRLNGALHGTEMQYQVPPELPPGGAPATSLLPQTMTNDDIKIRRMRPIEPLSAKDAEFESKLRNLVLQELYGRLWHTTIPDRYERILSSSAILPEPDIPDADRWSTSQGKDLYPYVRSLGGVSLFDFDQLDPDTYAKDSPNSAWYEFVPYQRIWGESVWIEIDRVQVARQLISAPHLLDAWKLNSAGRKIMPGIEAAYRGPLPRTAFKRAFLVSKGDSQFHPLRIS